ncbi:MAG: prepilin-type N-terminal cleavage/methylation domain-containing protein [Planctomycetaceae bacterium]|nr:prepilin-type N-terminal cleavage/methylation domain-containing protein [Planctomycetaceae bacterium]
MVLRGNNFCRHKQRRGGFTLVEMLMTLVLSAVLMAGLWNLFSSYTRLFDTGQQIAAESRVARAVLDQLATDLDGLADVSLLDTSNKVAVASLLKDSSEETSGSGSSPASSSLPQFRLTGTSDSLRLNIYQPGPPRLPRDKEGEDESLSSQLEDPEFYAPDLRVVLYDFTEKENTLDSGDSLPIGLIRRELDWQSALALTVDEDEAENELALEDEELTSDDQRFLSDSYLEDMELSEIIAADLRNEQFLWVPEVVKLKFRYSDGQTWSESWDSQYRKTLPLLVEVSMEFDYQQGVDARYLKDDQESEIPTEQELAEDEEALDPEENLNELLDDEDDLPQYRRVIALKTAFQQKKSSSTSDSSNSETALSRLQDAETDSEEGGTP